MVAESCTTPVDTKRISTRITVVIRELSPLLLESVQLRVVEQASQLPVVPVEREPDWTVARTS
jgi:hypothetical protein